MHPQNSHTHTWLGFLSADIGSTDPSACARTARHFQRGLAIARQQQRDWWTARLVHRRAVLATADQVAAVPPAEVAGQLAEADAAYRRCHTILPWQWVAELKRWQMSGRAMQPAIEAHTQRGAAGWDSDLRQLGSQDYSEARAAVRAHLAAAARCSGCGESSLVLAGWPQPSTLLLIAYAASCLAAVQPRVPSGGLAQPCSVQGRTGGRPAASGRARRAARLADTWRTPG